MVGKDPNGLTGNPNGLTGILFGTRQGMLVEVLYEDSGELFETTYVHPKFVAAAYPELTKI